MTEIVFHHDVPERLSYVARLLRKAYQKNVPIVVLGEAGLLEALSQQLCQMSETDFIPHSLDLQAEHIRAASPIWLLRDLPEIHDGFERLINLKQALPHGFERFNQLIEVIDLEASNRQSGRSRLQHYKTRGYAISYHKAS